MDDSSVSMALSLSSSTYNFPLFFKVKGAQHENGIQNVSQRYQEKWIMLPFNPPSPFQPHENNLLWNSLLVDGQKTRRFHPSLELRMTFPKPLALKMDKIIKLMMIKSLLFSLMNPHTVTRCFLG